MTLSAQERKQLFDSLKLEDQLAIGAALAADAADQYDVGMARLLDCREPSLVAEAIARVGDATPVRRAAPPHGLLEGGYGKSFGTVTVGDKAKFLLGRVLGPQRAAEAIAQGPAWVERHSLVWDPRRRQFVADSKA